MFCYNCGNEIKEDAKFCSSCGAEVKHAAEKQPENSSVEVKEEKPKEQKTIVDHIVSFVGIVGGWIIGRYLGIVVLLFIACYAVGEWFHKWYLKREHVNPDVIKWIVWSNVLTWFLPPLGIMTGFAALGFSNHFSDNMKKYKTLAIIGIFASLINALSGVLLRI
jgi:hypothetical protein